MARVMVFTPSIPHDTIHHAGGRYLNALCVELQTVTDLQLVSPDRRGLTAALSSPGAPIRVTLVGQLTGRGFGAIARRLLRRLERLLRVVDPDAPPHPGAFDLVTGEGRRLFAAEQPTLVDLQWSHWIRLAPIIRHLAPQARLVGTFHDVTSQRFDRMARQTRGHRRLRWTIARELAKVAERRAMRVLDAVVVFSEKDRQLLPRWGQSRVTVIDPPLAGADLSRTRQPSPDSPIIVVVGYFGRSENAQAAEWFLDEILPSVVKERPDVRVRFIGKGMPQRLIDAHSADPRVVFAGFVADLGSEYAQAAVAAIPLLSGAGVKFKALEALIAGVPTVTTSVGAEGIGGRELFAGIHDDPASFARAIVAVLADQTAAENHASGVRSKVQKRYGPQRFSDAVRAVYLNAGGS